MSSPKCWGGKSGVREGEGENEAMALFRGCASEEAER